MAIIGDQPEALLLSVLFAETNTSNYLVGPFQPSLQRRTGRTGWDQALWLLNIHYKNETIKILDDIKELPLGGVTNVVLTTHAVNQEASVTNHRVVRAVGQSLQKNCNLTFTGLSRPGYTHTIGEALEKYSGFQVGRELGLCYLPLLWNGESLQAFRETPRIIAGQGPEAVFRVQETFLIVFPAISVNHKTSAAEAAGLFTPVYREVVRALQFELASLCVGEGVDYSEALDLCRGLGLSLAFPKPIPGRNSIGSEIALSSNYRGNGPRLIRAASRVNEGVQQQIMSMVKSALERCGRRLRRSRIAVLGLEGLGARPIITHQPPEILEILRRRGAILSLYAGEDSDWVAGSPISQHVRIEKSIVRAVEGANCALVALDRSNGDELNPQKLAAEMSRPAAICDLTQVLEASNVERAGLFYTSIGRGSPGA